MVRALEARADAVFSSSSPRSAGFLHTFSCAIRPPHDGNLNDRGLDRGRYRGPRPPANHPLALAQLGSKPLGPPKPAGSPMARPKNGETAHRTGTLAKRAASRYERRRIANRRIDDMHSWFSYDCELSHCPNTYKTKGIHLGEGIYFYPEYKSESSRIFYYVFYVGLAAFYVFLESLFVTLWFMALPLRRWERHRETAILRAQRVLLSAGMTNEAGKQWFKALLKDPDTLRPSFLSKVFLSKDRS